MYEVDNRTDLTYIHHDEQFTATLEKWTADKENTDLAIVSDKAMMRLVRDLYPLMKSKDMEKFLELWSEADFCELYDYFFYKSEVTEELYIVISFCENFRCLTFYDFIVDTDGYAYKKWRETCSAKFVQVRD